MPIPLDEMEGLRKWTFGNRPSGEGEFVATLEMRFGRVWLRKKSEKRSETDVRQSMCVTAGEYPKMGSPDGY